MQPKHAVAKYSEYIIFIVLCYSDPTMDTDFLFNYLETRKISEKKNIPSTQSNPYCYTTCVSACLSLT